MSNANQVRVKYARESTWGGTPSTPAVREMRITSESLTHAKATRVSQQVRSDRQRAALLEVGQMAQGAIDFELAYGVDFEQWLETALRGTIASTRVIHASTVFAASSITRSGVGAGYSTLQVGQWFRLKTSGANNGRVAKIAAKTSTVITVTGGVTLSTGTASAQVIGRTLKNGVVSTSYFVEVDFTDLTQAHKYFLGLDVDQMSLNIRAQEIITGSFALRGSRGFYSSAGVAGTITSALITEPMTAAVNVAQIRRNGALLTDDVQAFTLQLNNNMRDRPRVGNKIGAEQGDGGEDITGTLMVYFSRIGMFRDMVDHTSNAIELKLQDTDGNVIVIQLPTVKLSEGTPTTPGLDQDVSLPLAFQAIRDTTQNAQIRIDFLPV